ncbi:polysaccharide lyase [Paenirhodobacter sp.]|uniref:polysaccharide lyase n=1 Tax=Paenirhodobacter sp. TaxID=1965326 RepID=UPI003B5031C1
MRTSALMLLCLLLPRVACADPATLTLRYGFDGQDFAPEGGLYYRENYEQSAGHTEFQRSVVRAGAGALRLWIEPLCQPGEEGCSERAEIWEQTALRVPYETGVWYGLSMRFDDPPPALDHRYVVMQWKREIGPDAEGDFSPFLALRLRSGVVFATVETNFRAPPADAPRPVAGRCPAGWTPVWLRPGTRQMRALVATGPHWTDDVTTEFDRCTDAIRIEGPGLLPVAAAQWHDYAFYTRPGPGGDGLIRIFADGAPVVTVRGRIGHADHGLGQNQYFKFGPYRDGGEGTWAMYYDSFIRTPDCTALLPAGACTGLE